MLKRIGKPCLLAIVTSIAGATDSQDLLLRLETPLASYSRPGTPFSARIMGRYEGSGPPAVLPPGTTVRGSVKEARSVGLGLRRERAGLMLEFEPACQLPNGETAACDVQLLAVDNARESVHRGNRIRGALAASHPPSLLSGIWYRPAAGILLRPVSGMAGAGGMMCSRLAPGPVGAAIFVATRLLFFRIPDLAIELPAGTDLIARIAVREASRSSELEAEAENSAALPDGFTEWLQDAPIEPARPDGAAVEDRINLVFLAGEREIQAAFEAAGWQGTDPLTAKTFVKSYSAFVKMRAYDRAPVSVLHYEGRPPDLVFQKTFNTVARRHHIRLWKKVLPSGETAWLGAATHDVGIVFDWKRMTLVHRIDPRIDRERGKVVSDLRAAACIEGITSVAREQADDVEAEATGKPGTDGAIWAVQLGACQTKAPDTTRPSRPHASQFTVAVRRVVLESRYYLTRANAYTFTYDSIRRLVDSRRSHTISDWK